MKVGRPIGFMPASFSRGTDVPQLMTLLDIELLLP
jgi:hypothetical protein